MKRIIVSVLAIAVVVVAYYWRAPVDCIQAKLEAEGLHCVVLHETTNPILVVSEASLSYEDAFDFSLNPYASRHSDKALVTGIQFGVPHDALVIRPFFALGNTKLLSSIKGRPKSLTCSGVK